MFQNRQIVISTFNGYLDFLAETQPELSREVACQVAAMLTQAEYSLQIADATRKV